METIVKSVKNISMQRNTCTELELHAFVDNELASQEKEKVLNAALQSPSVRDKLNDLQTLKDLLRYSYSQK